MSGEPLLTEIRDGVLILTINRPEKRNALNLALLDAIGATFVANADEPSIRCAVVTAAGNRAFAAGGDLQELDSIRSETDTELMSRRGRVALDRIRDFPLPVVAGLNGLALGGGAELAMACDLRVAAANAEIGFLQAQLNVTTAWGGGIDLIAATGSAHALDLLLGARRIPAGKAHELGLVNYLCAETESLEDGLRTFLEPYLQRSRAVLKGFKALSSARRRDVHDRLRDTEETSFIAAWTSDAHWDAVEKAAAARKSRASD